MTYGSKWNKGKKLYRKAFGHRSPYTRVYGHRNPGEALDVTMDNVRKMKGKIKQIRERLNVEKKHVDDVHHQGLSVSQVHTTTATDYQSGHKALDVTPTISQGHGSDDRNGNSLKFTGINFKIQLQGQDNCHSARRVRFTLCRVGCGNDTPSAVFEHMYDKNPLTSEGSVDIRDLQAPLNYTTLKTKGIKVVARRTFYVPAQAINTGDNKGDLTHKSCSFSVKLQDTARYSGDSQTLPENFRYYLFVQTDVGNSGSHDCTASDIPIVKANSGIVARFASRIWYVDN